MEPVFRSRTSHATVCAQAKCGACFSVAQQRICRSRLEPPSRDDVGRGWPCDRRLDAAPNDDEVVAGSARSFVELYKRSCAVLPHFSAFHHHNNVPSNAAALCPINSAHSHLFITLHYTTNTQTPHRQDAVHQHRPRPRRRPGRFDIRAVRSTSGVRRPQWNYVHPSYRNRKPFIPSLWQRHSW